MCMCTCVCSCPGTANTTTSATLANATTAKGSALSAGGGSSVSRCLDRPPTHTVVTRMSPAAGASCAIAASASGASLAAQLAGVPRAQAVSRPCQS